MDAVTTIVLGGVALGSTVGVFLLLAALRDQRQATVAWRRRAIAWQKTAWTEHSKKTGTPWVESKRLLSDVDWPDA